ncbi:NUDIX hydrolase [Homoserinibacter sp. YIM 151385]|uniref:NUDIX hydrolase n=1 Tax=Homoserinibacter sp. YIM 151385 TaxID=2985506 RepID=UPI0022F0CC27|nr:NUDIX domain-containing protein [Homoserinibacter sp. YIM 151385]WBU39314.1 NUDIX domain-containing protein [Homoserinibacter sp. YIM 151385]
MSAAASSPVLAAGAVCWRVEDGKVRILLVHRTQHQDISLPKGKLDPGETLPETAVREIAEETGLIVGLGAPLGVVEYQLPSGRDKSVYYWAAEVEDHALANSTFASNDEIRELEWVGLARARKILSYDHDIDIVERFAELWERGRARTFAIIALRHGKAAPHGEWSGPDHTRPLVDRGRTQAASVAPGIAAYRPRKLMSSTAVRCVSTIEPAARLTGLPVKQTDAISQDAYEQGESGVDRIVAKRLRKAETAVLCSHGPVLPEILAAVGRGTGTHDDGSLWRASMLSVGEYAVVHISADHPESGIVAVEVHGPSC